MLARWPLRVSIYVNTTEDRENGERSMAEIIRFPTKAVKDWNIISQSIGKVLAESGVDDKMSEIIIERLKIFYDKINKVIDFNVKYNLCSDIGQDNIDAIKKGIKEGVQFGLKQVQTIIHEILFERILTEIKIYKLEHNIQ